MRQTIGEFLIRRLEEVGVRHIFGVPGDYNLGLLQQLEDRGRPEWIGNCNELNASYAADGYARINGLAALIVTHGVGALSAVNGIAGSYSEHVPVICICGTVPQKSLDQGRLMHHTMADGSRDRFYRVLAELTAAQAQLCPENAAAEIDRLILTAWRRKLPVYLELPSDMGFLSVEVPEAPLALTCPASDGERLGACSHKIISRLQRASSPVLLIGDDAARFGALPQIEVLAEKLQIPSAVFQGSKGLFPEDSPLFAGVYMGAESQPRLRALVEGSDCVLTVGFRRVDWTSACFTDRLPENAVHLRGLSADVGEENFQGIFLRELLAHVIDGVRQAPRKPRPFPGAGMMEPPPAPSQDHPLTQDQYWQAMQRFVQPGDVIVGEAGTSAAGANGLHLPPGTTFITQAIWGSIGYSVGCLLGTLLAAPERRHILLVGDGSFQLTGQEVSTMLRHGLKPFIFLVNNGGYTVEKTILGGHAKYNDIAKWSYTGFVKALGLGQAIETFVVKTSRELSSVLSSPHSEMVFVEVVMDPDDAPLSLFRFGKATANLIYGSRGPQLISGSQITRNA